MALNLEFEFPYETWVPTIDIAVLSRTGSRVEVTAVVDTGADGTLLDLDIAEALRLDLSSGRRVTIGGVGGHLAEAIELEVDFEFVDQPVLGGRIRATFAPGVGDTHGNLLGMNVLALFDFGLAHAQRLAYLGLATPS